MLELWTAPTSLVPPSKSDFVAEWCFDATCLQALLIKMLLKVRRVVTKCLHPKYGGPYERGNPGFPSKILCTCTRLGDCLKRRAWHARASVPPKRHSPVFTYKFTMYATGNTPSGFLQTQTFYARFLLQHPACTLPTPLIALSA